MKLSVNNFAAFAGKEVLESIRSKRLFVMLCVFMVLTIMNVLMARFMAEIIAAIMSADGGAQIVIEVPPTVWTDSYAQVYSGFVEMGMFAMIMLFMGIILREKRTGTIDLMMAKGVTPFVFVLAKYAVAAAIVLLSLFASILVAYGYTFVLFDYAGNIGDVLFGAVAFSVFLLMMLAITFLWSAVAGSTAISAVLGVASYFALMFLDMIPVVNRFSPGGIFSYSVSLSIGGGQERLLIRAAVALAIAVICLFLATQSLKKREG